MNKQGIVIIMVISIMFFPGFLSAATFQPTPSQGDEHPILVTLADGPIDLHATVDFLHFGWTAPSSTVFSNQREGNPRCTIKNLGDATIDYMVQATISGGWILGTVLGDVGPDRCVVAAIFTAAVLSSEVPFPDGRELNYGDFGNNDVLSPVPLQATTDILARDNTAPDPDDPDSKKGFGVTPLDSIRSLRFMVETPTGDNFGVEQIINITIGAVAQ